MWMHRKKRVYDLAVGIDMDEEPERVLPATDDPRTTVAATGITAIWDALNATMTEFVTPGLVGAVDGMRFHTGVLSDDGITALRSS